MGREQIEALIAILQEQVEQGPGNVVTGSWSISWDKTKQGFYFDKCEAGGYCEERPALVALSGEVLDRGGPIGG